MSGKSTEYVGIMAETIRFRLVAEFIYTMKKARKAHGDKVILDDVTLMFLPGAKIGVVGPNGAGKSTVLQIMAGLQQPSNGEAYISPGYSVGILLEECSRKCSRRRCRNNGAARTFQSSFGRNGKP